MRVHPFRILLLILLSFCFSAGIAYAQMQEEDDDGDYNREFVWGIHKTTNGGYIGGFNAKFSRRMAPGTFRTMGFEVANVKHSRESRFVNRSSGGSFILGKVNYLYSLRFSYGIERVVFKKGYQQGVQINLLASGGPSLGIIAPYYVEYADNTNYSTTMPYDPSLNPQSIFGHGRPFEGIGQSMLAPGLHLRTGVSFEFGTFKSNVSGVEIGVMTEAYSQRVELLSRQNDTPQWFFPAAYITLFHGNRR